MSSETLLNFYRTTPRYDPEDNHLQTPVTGKTDSRNRAVSDESTPELTKKLNYTERCCSCAVNGGICALAAYC